MSQSFNQFTLIGRVGNYIEQKELECQDGNTRTITEFTLVVDQPKSDEPNVFFIKTWSPAGQWLRTGRLVLVHGELETWRSESSRGINLKAFQLTLLDSKPTDE
jgi:single-stranded DNA-binding protein